MQIGYVKFHRQFLDWEWYDNVNCRLTFMHLLLSVNYEPNRWQGVLVHRGQMVTSYANLAKAVGISLQSLRTVLNKLQKTGEVIVESTNKFVVVTLVNFDTWQGDQHTINNQITINQQSINNQSTTLKEVKKERSKEYTLSTTQKELSIPEKIKRSASKLGVKSQDAEKEKSSAKKEKAETTEIAPIDLSDFPAIEDTNTQRLPEKRLKWLKNGKGTVLELTLANYQPPENWKEDFIETVYGFFDYMVEKKGAGWGGNSTVKAQINQFKEWLKEYSFEQVTEGIEHCILKGNSTPNPLWKINFDKSQKEKDEKRNSNSAKSNSTNKAKSLSSAARAASFFANQHAESDDPKDNPWFDQSN